MKGIQEHAQSMISAIWHQEPEARHTNHVGDFGRNFPLCCLGATSYFGGGGRSKDFECPFPTYVHPCSSVGKEGGKLNYWDKHNWG